MSLNITDDKSALLRSWLGVVRHQAITWANVDPNLCHHMSSQWVNPCHAEFLFDHGLVSGIISHDFHDYSLVLGQSYDCPKASDETLKNGWSIGDPGFYTLNSTANLSISPPVTWSWACGSYRRLCNTPPYLLSNQWLQAYLASAVLEPRASADVWGHPSGYGTHRRSVSSCPPHGVVGLEGDSISWSRSSGTGIPSVLADPVWDNVNSVIHYDQWGYILMA